MTEGDFSGEIVDAWNKLEKAPNLRKNSKWLKDVDDWVKKGLNIETVGNKIKIKKGVEEVGEIANDLLKIRHAGFGGDIVAHPTKTTTVLGKFIDTQNGGGTGKLIDSGLTKSGQNQGGINVLNFDGTGMNDDQVWTINRKWLVEAASRGDEIRVCSNPKNMINLSNPNSPDLLSFFGKEVKLLEQELGYTFDSVSKSFIKQ